MKNLFLCTPSHDGKVCTGYARGLAEITDLLAGVAFVNGISDVTLARNMQADVFLSSSIEWLLSVDADIAFMRSDVLKLIASESGRGYTIKIGTYVTRDAARLPITRGMGFALIHRDVFLGVRNFTRPFTHNGLSMHQYFASGIGNGDRFVGEDAAFFATCKAAGFLTRIVTGLGLVHWGAHPFSTLT